MHSADSAVREPRPEKPRPKTVRDYIDEAADRSAHRVLLLQRRAQQANHYRAMEALLRAYKTSKQWAEHPEEYGFFPTEKSKDISVAPPPGLGLRDRVEVNELFVQSKETSFVRSMARFSEVEAVVRLFESRPEFIIIRMYYFGEDEHGQDRGPDAKPYTFPEISEALSTIGIEWSEKAIRRRRTKLVRDMTVLMFGVDGALSIESTGARQEYKDNQEQRSEEVNDG